MDRDRLGIHHDIAVLNLWISGLQVCEELHLHRRVFLDARRVTTEPVR